MNSVALRLVVAATAGLILPLWASAAGPKPPTSRGLLLVANKWEHTLGIVDPVEGRQLAKVTVGANDHEVVASPDGRFAYVPIYGNSVVGQAGTNGRVVDIVDISARRLIGTIDLGKPVRPHCAVMGPDGMLYVTEELAHAVAVINPSTRKVVGSIPTEQPESHMLVLSSDGKLGYTANISPGTVSVLDMVHRRTVTVIHVAKMVQRISITPDNRRVFTADQKQPRLAVINTEENKVVNWIPLPGIGFGTRVTPNGRWLLATIPGLDKIAVISLKSLKVTRTLSVPKAPQEILMRPDGRVAYVSCDSSHEVAVINLGTWRVEKLIQVGRGDDGLAWAPLNP